MPGKRTIYKKKKKKKRWITHFKSGRRVKVKVTYP